MGPASRCQPHHGTPSSPSAPPRLASLPSQPEVYTQYLKNSQEEYFTRNEELPQKVAELHAKGFPERKPVDVG